MAITATFALFIFANLNHRNVGSGDLVLTYGWPFAIEKYMTLDLDQPLVSYKKPSDMPEIQSQFPRTTIEFNFDSLILNTLVAVGISCTLVFLIRITKWKFKLACSAIRENTG